MKNIINKIFRKKKVVIQGLGSVGVTSFGYKGINFEVISDKLKGLYIVSSFYSNPSVGRISSSEKSSSFGGYTNMFLPEIEFVKLRSTKIDTSALKLKYDDIKDKTPEEIKELASKEIEKDKNTTYLGILDKDGVLVNVIEDSN